MAFKLTKANYDALRKMNMRQRMDVAKDENTGRWLLSLLTPTQLAELFPLYYRKTAMPDISGFTRAMPTSMTLAKQKAIEEQLANTASGERAGSNMRAGGWKEKWQRDMSEAQSARISKSRPAPQLTPEQQETFNTLKASPLAVDDPRAKMFSNLSDDQLAQVGVKKTVVDGKNFYAYTAPTVSDDEVKKSMIPSGDFSQKSANLIPRLQNELGITREQAAGILGSLGGETDGLHAINEKTPVVPGSRGGFGWAQWTGDRRRQFESFAASRGLDIRSDEANLQFLVHELKTTESRALSQLKSTSSVEEAARIFTGSAATKIGFLRPGVEHYEKSIRYARMAYDSGDPITQDFSDKKMEVARERLIRQIETKRIGSLAEFTNAGLPAPGSTDAAQFVGTSKNAQEVADRIKSQFGNLDNPQCVALAKAYVGATGSVTDWRRGNNVMDGTLKPGTPIATFMNRDGSPSSLYDGGGTGAPGNHTTHAAIFLDYERDNAGRITGIRVMEQFKGSNGAHERVYPVGGTGTSNAANYHSINDARTGGPLGTNNPMILSQQKETAKVEPKNEKKNIGDLKDFTSSDTKPKAPEPEKKKEETKVETKKEEHHTEKKIADVTVERDGKKVDVSPDDQKKVDTANKVREAMQNPPTQVKSNADGGVNKINTEEISAYPINGLRGDNAVVVNAQQKPLFTMNTNEKMLVDPKNDTAQVLPEQKEQAQNNTNEMFNEFKTAIDQLRQEFSQNKAIDPKSQDMPNRFDHVDGSYINSLNEVSKQWYQTPSMQRAAYRAGGMETGEPVSNFHYSNGNRS